MTPEERKQYNKEKIKCPHCHKDMTRGGFIAHHKNSYCPKNGSLKKHLEEFIIYVMNDDCMNADEKNFHITITKERLKKCS
jgi:hypothetical protein